MLSSQALSAVRRIFFPGCACDESTPGFHVRKTDDEETRKRRLNHLQPSFYLALNDYDAENNWYATGAKSDTLLNIFVRPSRKIKDEYNRIRKIPGSSPLASNYMLHNGGGQGASAKCILVKS